MEQNKDSFSIKLVNVNQEIMENQLKEVTSDMYYIPGTSVPSDNGLFSFDIFGRVGTKERKEQWAYINLNETFMAPHAFYVFSRLKNKIADDMKNGAGNYYIDSTGEITKLLTGQTVPETALVKEIGSGFDWMKKHWDKISWKIEPSMTNMAKSRRKFLKSLDINQVFWDKLLVMPAFYRDFDASQKKDNEINKMYKSALRLGKILKKTDELIYTPSQNLIDSATGKEIDMPTKSITYLKLHTALYTLYDYFFLKISGANGFINEHVVGKPTDFGARLVITTPSYNTETYADCEVDFFHSSVPLSVAANLFNPFMVHGIAKWFKNYIAGRRSVRYYDRETKTFRNCDLAIDYMAEFSATALRDKLEKYRDYKTFRVEPVTIKGQETIQVKKYNSETKSYDMVDKVVEKRIPIQAVLKMGENNIIHVNPDSDLTMMDGLSDEEMAKNIRNITWCELIYVIAEDVLHDKVIYNTRYPADDYYHTYPSMMNIVPCVNYTQAFFKGKLYKRYPIINVSPKDHTKIEQMFVDSMRMHSTYPNSLGADFDGDQISTQSLFSEEANSEARKHMVDMNNVIGINGEIVRSFPTVVKHGIYGLTYRIPKPEGVK